MGNLAGNSCGKILWENLAGNSCGKILREIVAGKSCGKFLQQMLWEIPHTYLQTIWFFMCIFIVNKLYGVW